MTVSRHTLPATIVTGLTAVDRDAAISELARAIDPARGVQDGDQLHATVIDRGVAVARLITGSTEPGEPTGESLTIGVGLAPRGIDFDSYDGSPVRILFLIVADDLDVSRYLEILTAIFALIATPGFEDRVLSADTAEAALGVIRSLEPEPTNAEPMAELCTTTAGRD